MNIINAGSREYILNRCKTASASRQLTFLRVLQISLVAVCVYALVRRYRSVTVIPGHAMRARSKAVIPGGGMGREVRRRFLRRNVPCHRRAEIGRGADSCMRRTEPKCGSTIRACASTVRRNRGVV